MISFLKGNKVEIDPSKVIVDVNGIGYKVNISLRTYSKIKDLNELYIYTHLHVKEDAHTLYGFYNKMERKTFLDLVSISGVGPSTAVVILSSLSADELKIAIIDSDVNKIKSVKGIGQKTAERIILELKDKISKDQKARIEKLKGDLVDLNKGSDILAINNAIQELSTALSEVGQEIHAQNQNSANPNSGNEPKSDDMKSQNEPDNIEDADFEVVDDK